MHDLRGFALGSCHGLHGSARRSQVEFQHVLNERFSCGARRTGESGSRTQRRGVRWKRPWHAVIQECAYFIGWQWNIVRTLWPPLLDISLAQQIRSREIWITVQSLCSWLSLLRSLPLRRLESLPVFHKFIERLSRRLQWNAMKWEQQREVAQQVSAVHAAPRRLGILHDSCCATPWCSQALWLALRLWLWAKQPQPQSHHLDRAINSNQLAGTICSSQWVGYALAWVDFTSLLRTHHESRQAGSFALKIQVANVVRRTQKGIFRLQTILA